VAKSEAATAAVTSGQATFTQALLVAKFDGDAKAVTELTECIAEGYGNDELTHTAARLRQDRERKGARAAILANLVADGKRVPGEDDDYESLDRLTDADDDVTGCRARTADRRDGVRRSPVGIVAGHAPQPRERPGSIPADATTTKARVPRMRAEEPSK
jgi:ParB family chromosome partitioning protein